MASRYQHPRLRWGKVIRGDGYDELNAYAEGVPVFNATRQHPDDSMTGATSLWEGAFEGDARTIDGYGVAELKKNAQQRWVTGWW